MKRLSFALILIFFLTACKPIISLLENNPNKTSCFYDLCIGKKYRPYITDGISRIPNVNMSSISYQEYLSFPNEIFGEYFWNLESSKESGGVIAVNNIGEIHSLELHYKNSNMSLETMLDILGSPDYFVYSYNNIEKLYLSVFFIYKNEGIILCSEIITYGNKNTFNIQSTTPVSNIWFVNPNNNLQDLKNGYIESFPDCGLQKYRQGWYGFKEYSFIRSFDCE